VETLTLTNANGIELRCIPLGGIIVSLKIPDRRGVLADVVLGYDELDEYVVDTRFVGALIGRYANRIENARFSIDGREYDVARNEGPNHLHGGDHGFHKAMWAAESIQAPAGPAIRFRHTSPDGDEGFPGTLVVTVTYTLTADNALIVDYEATTDRATPVNLTQHAYINLAGHDRADILAHELTLHASHYLAVDGRLIPSGEPRSVHGTPFDFTTPQPIGSRIRAADEQLALGHGYDHNFVIDRGAAGPDDVVLAAQLLEPVSGRTMDLYTTEPGVQLYTGNGFDDHFIGKDWHVYLQHAGLALEPQHFPNSPNRPDFPSTILRPGETYRSRSVYRFGAI
jgi:aldose 1-epimerase